MKSAIYPGSFDPPTNGHLDIIKRATNLVDNLIVAVLNNPSKNPMFSTEEKIEMLEELTKDMENITVVSFSGLLVDFCEEMHCNIVLRGLRAMTDFEYEFQIALTNRTLNKNIETLFIPTDVLNVWLSSSIVKEIARFGGKYEEMVPKFVKSKIQEKLIEGANMYARIH